MPPGFSREEAMKLIAEFQGVEPSLRRLRASAMKTQRLTVMLTERKESAMPFVRIDLGTLVNPIADEV
jgi:hypothetical protein